jgi:hypothetical protein
VFSEKIKLEQGNTKKDTTPSVIWCAKKPIFHQLAVVAA